MSLEDNVNALAARIGQEFLTLRTEQKQIVPFPPQSGTYVLHSVDGVLSWVPVTP